MPSIEFPMARAPIQEIVIRAFSFIDLLFISNLIALIVVLYNSKHKLQ